MMDKRLSFWLSGAAFGVAFELIAAIVLSSALHLGYIMLCPAWLPEQVGGEINAVLVQTIFCAGVGMSVKRMLKWVVGA